MLELRVLDGANIYFSRPAVALTLAVSALVVADGGALRQLAGAARARGGRPGEVVGAGTTVRHTPGHSLGGVRLPAMPVPLAAYTRTGDCVALDGRTEAFTQAQRRRLYPTHSDYVAKVSAAIRRSVKAGVLTTRDAAEILTQAHASRP